MIPLTEQIPLVLCLKQAAKESPKSKESPVRQLVNSFILPRLVLRCSTWCFILVLMTSLNNGSIWYRCVQRTGSSKGNTAKYSSNVGRQEERGILFNDAVNTFYLRLYGIGHMVSGHSDSERGTRWLHYMDYSFWLAARVILYALSHRQDITYHGLCYIGRGALAIRFVLSQYIAIQFWPIVAPLMFVVDTSGFPFTKLVDESRNKPNHARVKPLLNAWKYNPHVTNNILSKFYLQNRVI